MTDFDTEQQYPVAVETSVGTSHMTVYGQSPRQVALTLVMMQRADEDGPAALVGEME